MMLVPAVMLAWYQWDQYRGKTAMAVMEGLRNYCVLLAIVLLPVFFVFRQFVQQVVLPVEGVLQCVALPAGANFLAVGDGAAGKSGQPFAELVQRLQGERRAALEGRKKLDAYENVFRRGMLRMLEMERERREWRGMLSAELERVSRIILGCAAWMGELPASAMAEAVAEGGQEIAEAGHHLQFLAQSLAVKRDSGGSPPGMPCSSLDDVVRQVTVLLEPAMQRRSIEISSQLSGAEVMLQPSAILHAVWGALSLALRFAAPESRLRIVSRQISAVAVALTIEVSRAAPLRAHPVHPWQEGLVSMQEERFRVLEAVRSHTIALIGKPFFGKKADSCRIAPYGGGGFLLELRFGAAPPSLSN